MTTTKDLARELDTLTAEGEADLSALFETPMLRASITVDDPSVPIAIDAEAIAEAVRGVVGMDIDLRVRTGNDFRR